MFKTRNMVIMQSIVELSIAVLLIIISIPLWINLNNTGYSEIAEYYESYNSEN